MLVSPRWLPGFYTPTKPSVIPSSEMIPIRIKTAFVEIGNFKLVPIRFKLPLESSTLKVYIFPISLGTDTVCSRKENKRFRV